MKFEKFHLSEDLLRNLNDNGFFRTTDIQFKAIPSIMKGEDVLAIAQTGTGKTAAFAIPIINGIHSNKSSKRVLGIKCLVMVPTRELAQQIGEVFNRLSKHTKVKPFALFGGVEQDAQIKKLQDGIDILIATPGRMFDLISQGFIDISHIETLVLDEADHMLDLGFIDDIESIKRKMTRRHQTLFFSATISPEIKKLAFSQVRSSAIRIQISPEDPVSKNVSHFVMNVEMDDKRFFLAEYLKQNPEGKFIIFVRTRVRAERVAKAMERVDIKTLTIHGEKDQTDRAEVMKAFRSGDCKILIATDLSARGIDIPDVTHVINYDLPEKPENYVHRIGRTGRGFNKGIAVSFCSQEEKPLLAEIETLLTKKIEVIKVSKKDYQIIASQPESAIDASLQDLLDSEDTFKKSKRKKK
ncbi:DEAD/DEAH box helicase [Bdellovibrio svalbardensis]|uniref:DEAD/DEAH box helicase n=1 Tax=Bdellovibrio svalbardensis TaxID=2972972 RepID=A0ABT6DK13_9BACT|nr:DEAD/DEAH box helicase [Bdellovibrio svalbardensis]MDG0817210.1 DEAD/DEAH box helicase [Bdellovibrio svalbardensis]